MTGGTERDPSFERVAQLTTASVLCLGANPKAREARNAADDAPIFEIFIGGHAHGHLDIGAVHGGSP